MHFFLCYPLPLISDHLSRETLTSTSIQNVTSPVKFRLHVKNGTAERSPPPLPHPWQTAGLKAAFRARASGFVLEPALLGYRDLSGSV